MLPVSFPDVFEKRVFQGQGEESGCFSCAALFEGFAVGRTQVGRHLGLGSKLPNRGPKQEKDYWAALIAECNRVSMEAFKKPMGELDRAVYKLPFHRGEEKEYTG